MRIEHHAKLSDSLLEELETLEVAIFASPISKDAFRSELEGRHDVVILVSRVDEEARAYKIGYQDSPSVFFSWSGGVHPDFRRQGIARALMTEQHRIAKGLGYEFVRTHTKNKYRAMLLLDIGFGFDITGVNNRLDEQAHTIVLEKRLD